MCDFDLTTFTDLTHADLATGSELEITQVKRLLKDAYWLARDHIETERLRQAGDHEEVARRAREIQYERDLRIASDALCSIETTAARRSGAVKPYSARQARLFDEHNREREYLRRLASENSLDRLCGRPISAPFVIEGHDADGVVTLTHQSAYDRFEGGGFRAGPGYYGGSSTQPDGGTCRQQGTHEVGKRSTKSVFTQRYLAATPKPPGKRRKGISDKSVIQRIVYLDGIGKTAAEIASEVGEKVGRVNGVLHVSAHGADRHWVGNNNDRRNVHTAQAVGA